LEMSLWRWLMSDN